MKYYHRHLPHFLPTEAIFFVTFRLANSLPPTAVAALQSEYEMIKRLHPEDATIREIALKKYFLKFDQLLDEPGSPVRHLMDERIAGVVQEAIHFRDGKDYELFAYSIMPNHVHMVFRLHDDTTSLVRVLQSLKKNTAIRANRILHGNGAFWQHESYDHVVRDEEECGRIIRYVLDNPVQAGMVRSAEEWKWSYYKSE